MIKKVALLKRINDRLIATKFVLDEKIIMVSSAYAPQVDLEERVKKQFWEEMDGIKERGQL